jgi:amidohydrolase
LIDITERAASIEGDVIAWRRRFHSNPELSRRETATGEAVRAELLKRGIISERIRGSESFFALLKGAKPGPAKILRADMDALPITESGEREYKSRRDGVMHACGHDAHTAMLMGAAAVLSECRDELRGTAVFCFQSAEEVNEGAAELINVLKERDLDIALAAGLHIWSQIPAGEIKILEGLAMAGLYAFRITLTGSGGHGSRPDRSIDPIKPLCELALKLSALPASLISPLETAVVHICHIEGGTAPNVFPDSAYLEGGIRFYRPEHREVLLDAIHKAARALSDQWGLKVKIEDLAALHPVNNDKGAVSLARDAAARVPGLELSASSAPLLASDNMSLFLEKYPGVYAFLGCGNADKGITAEHHNSWFDIDESVMRLGVEYLCRLAI